MTTRKRWIEEGSDADAFERDVLRSGLDANPPPQMSAQIWTRVVATFGPPAGPGGGAPPPASGGPVPPAAAPVAGGVIAAKSAGTWGAIAKGFALGAVVTGTITGGQRWPEDEPAAREVPAMTAVTLPPVGSGGAPSVAPDPREQASPASGGRLPDPTPAPRSGVPNTDPNPVLDPLIAGNPGPLRPAPVATFPELRTLTPSSASQLKEEADLIRSARAELRAGRLASAFATLEASRAKFAAPQLYQEREALTIELLHKSGQRESAALRARAFLERFPESPHGAQIRKLIESP